MGENARKRNNGLSKLPSTKEAKGYATLNELATIVWLKGEALLKKGDREGALAAYYTVLADFNYGQTWDTKGWYWSPAASCRDRIAELSPKSIKELSLETARCQRSSSFLVRRGFVLHCVKRREGELG